MIVAGAALALWVGLTVFWQEPFTGIYAGREQGRLAEDYERAERSYAEVPASPRGQDESAVEETLHRTARRYRLTLGQGKAVGRLTIQRLGLKRIVVNGASIPDLRKGPGRDMRSFMPGEGELVYIAGHRTTYGAPFRHIDDLRMGDWIHLDVPYGRFFYRVTSHRIVKPDDLRPLRSRGREELRLQASHPPYSAARRYVVYAGLVRVKLVDRR